jgi:hypothetical protein
MTMPRPSSRPLVDLVVHRFGYAVSLYESAEQACQFGKANLAIYGPPTFLLLGFSLENAFAAYLIACKHERPGDYKSHDLLKALLVCKPHGLVFAKADVEFVKKLTPLHMDFAFRYPEKMIKADVGDLSPSLATVKSIIRDVEVGLRIKGIDPRSIAESWPNTPDAQ